MDIESIKVGARLFLEQSRIASLFHSWPQTLLGNWIVIRIKKESITERKICF